MPIFKDAHPITQLPAAPNCMAVNAHCIGFGSRQVLWQHWVWQHAVALAALGLAACSCFGSISFSSMQVLWHWVWQHAGAYSCLQGVLEVQDLAAELGWGYPAPRPQSPPCTPKPLERVKKGGKDYAFWGQFNGKPSIIVGCPAPSHDGSNVRPVLNTNTLTGTTLGLCLSCFERFARVAT